MMTEELLSEEKRKAIKEVLHSIDIGLTDFNFGCITNHLKCENGVVTNTMTGFEGRGITDSFAVLNLIQDIWLHLSPIEKEEIREILK